MGEPFYKSDDYLVYNFDERMSVYSKIGDTNRYNLAMDIENGKDINRLPEDIKQELLKEMI